MSMPDYGMGRPIDLPNTKPSPASAAPKVEKQMSDKVIGVAADVMALPSKALYKTTFAGIAETVTGKEMPWYVRYNPTLNPWFAHTAISDASQAGWRAFAPNAFA